MMCFLKAGNVPSWRREFAVRDRDGRPVEGRACGGVLLQHRRWSSGGGGTTLAQG